MNKIICGIFCTFFIYNVNFAYAGQLPNIQQEQQMISRERDSEREQALHQRDELQDHANMSEDILPEEKIAFQIDNISIEGSDEHRFQFLDKIARKYEQNKIGVRGLQVIVKKLENALLEKGFVTSHISVLPQNLSDGNLKLLLVKGYVDNINFVGNADNLSYQQAFPVRNGDVLNLRSLEQGLEQLARMNSINAKVELLPGGSLGKSIVNIKVEQKRNIHGMITLDDGGNKSTGKILGGLYCTVDSFSGRDDIFTAYFSNDVMNGRADKRNNAGYGFSWNIPDGYASYSISYRDGSYDNPLYVLGNTFMYSGNSNVFSINASRVIERSRSTKTSVHIGMETRRSHNYLENVELSNQRRSTAAVAAGVVHRAYHGDDMWNISAFYKRGVPWFNPQHDAGKRTSRYNLCSLGIDYRHPFMLFKQKSRYTMSFYGQYTDDYLYAVDGMSIGNRYTVRGFDGENTLLGDSGYYIRNEVAIELGSLPVELYAAMDYGKVFGKNTIAYNSCDLLGTAVGLRGKVGRKAYWEAFVSWALKKPADIPNGKQVYGFKYMMEL